MFKKFAASFIIVTAASAFFSACSDDSSNAFAPVSTVESSSSSTAIENLSSSLDSGTKPVIPSNDSHDDSANPSAKSSSDAPASSSSQAVIPSNDSHDDSANPAAKSSNDAPVSSSAVPSSSSQAVIPSSDSREESRSSSSSPYLWNDEFDGDAIDTSKWSFEIGTGASGWGNNEWEYYTDRKENAYIKDGVLHIRAQKEDYKGSKYTSARMITKDKFSFTYGTVEARIALPTGKGIWPAFWMLGQNIDKVNWPACGEIDIIEAINDENIVYGTHHWQYNGNHASYGNNTKDYYGTSKELDITQFHTYKMVWNEKLIAMYVDDFKYQEIDIEKAKDGLEAFHKPQFFILNVAVAGSWPGFEVDDTQFPNEMLVDYIRVESRK
ncbi:MAG: glycoside hydrolase family 16 protein [Fibrobacter sp.]|nr:glycoside hydrolase family 16 protein [Fibrobacter sp.]